jgi:hypothetical protein
MQLTKAKVNDDGRDDLVRVAEADELIFKICHLSDETHIHITTAVLTSGRRG